MTVDEAIEVIHKHDVKKEHKMTREEACKKLLHAGYSADWKDGLTVNIMDMLEALGLLKFDEPVKERPSVHEILLYYVTSGSAHKMIDDIEKNGYRIITPKLEPKLDK